MSEEKFEINKKEAEFPFGVVDEKEICVLALGTKRNKTKKRG